MVLLAVNGGEPSFYWLAIFSVDIHLRCIRDKFKNLPMAKNKGVIRYSTFEEAVAFVKIL